MRNIYYFSDTLCDVMYATGTWSFMNVQAFPLIQYNAATP